MLMWYGNWWGQKEAGHETLEKGEVMILAIQFGALIFAVLLLSNFAVGQNYSSTPAITTVYWGAPPPGAGVTIKSGTNKESTNASSLSFFYSLAEGTHLVSVSASRFCTDISRSNGETETFTRLQFGYDSTRDSWRVILSPTLQRAEWSCTYSVEITDSTQQTLHWVGAVAVR